MRAARKNLGWIATTTLLAAGWTLREAQFSAAQGKRLPSATLNAGDVKLQAADFEGKPTGKIAVYLEGSTAGTRSMHSGRFLLDPGAQPHPPHRHPDEEVLIVTRGTGEVYLDGKTTPVKAGAMMYADPNVEHGIRNTGSQPLEFYWVKYLPAGK